MYEVTIPVRKFNVYKYDDLSEEAKETAKEQVREEYYNVRIINFDEEVDYWTREMFGYCVHFQYDFSCRQDSGFNLYGEFCVKECLNFIMEYGYDIAPSPTPELKKALDYIKEHKDLQEFLLDNDSDFKLRVDPNIYGAYCDFPTISKILDEFVSSYAFQIDYDYDAAEQMLNDHNVVHYCRALSQLVWLLCKKIYEAGCDYFLEIDEEEMYMLCADYDLLFLENGKLFDNLDNYDYTICEILKN